MRTKILELRDKATFIPVVAVKMMPDAANERYLLRRAGYSTDGNPLVLLTRADGGKSAYDPYDWGDRTFHTAHLYIEEHWNELEDGDVVDVEFILGETKERKLSEELTC